LGVSISTTIGASSDLSTGCEEPALLAQLLKARLQGAQHHVRVRHDLTDEELGAAARLACVKILQPAISIKNKRCFRCKF